ncbi:cell envelope integrity protein TolA [Candidatus Babeliales bacterium]|nr:cell envelope integrity protein TolA [Candidatus Babeliales bacterium]
MKNVRTFKRLLVLIFTMVCAQNAFGATYFAVPDMDPRVSREALNIRVESVDITKLKPAQVESNIQKLIAHINKGYHGPKLAPIANKLFEQLNNSRATEAQRDLGRQLLGLLDSLNIQTAAGNAFRNGLTRVEAPRPAPRSQSTRQSTITTTTSTAAGSAPSFGERQNVSAQVQGTKRRPTTPEFSTLVPNQSLSVLPNAIFPSSSSSSFLRPSQISGAPKSASPEANAQREQEKKAKIIADAELQAQREQELRKQERERAQEQEEQKRKQEAIDAEREAKEKADAEIQAQGVLTEERNIVNEFQAQREQEAIRAQQEKDAQTSYQEPTATVTVAPNEKAEIGSGAGLGSENKGDGTSKFILPALDISVLVQSNNANTTQTNNNPSDPDAQQDILNAEIFTTETIAPELSKKDGSETSSSSVTAENLFAQDALYPQPFSGVTGDEEDDDDATNFVNKTIAPELQDGSETSSSSDTAENLFAQDALYPQPFSGVTDDEEDDDDATNFVNKTIVPELSKKDGSETSSSSVTIVTTEEKPETPEQQKIKHQAQNIISNEEKFNKFIEIVDKLSSEENPENLQWLGYGARLIDNAIEQINEKSTQQDQSITTQDIEKYQAKLTILQTKFSDIKAKIYNINYEQQLPFLNALWHGLSGTGSTL